MPIIVNFLSPPTFPLSTLEPHNLLNLVYYTQTTRSCEVPVIFKNYFAPKNYLLLENKFFFTHPSIEVKVVLTSRSLGNIHKNVVLCVHYSKVVVLRLSSL